MHKKFFHLFILSIILFWIHSGTANASNDKPRPLEEIYPEIGYKTVEESVKEFEHHFNQDLKLPLRVPPIDFTHHFGRFNDLEGEINDSLEIELISDMSAEHHYKINVRPAKYKIPLKAKNVFKLKNGNDAIYTDVSGFNLLVFERDGWQYILSIDKRVSNRVPTDVFVEIANSFADQGE
ncbi:hypothetical protein [Mesobacillus selenatarsenatis]|uniref:DUF4367 domain-containing protein n=1 Tax=Mesobacillus selenatarsenatis (strain DSM 18680 / JCM 14380 / FERM P-15431 / SF-1) TaxID=1321606 RepID=A0A0A8WXR4_MESS1|nr:hypothetical protein [Mesobacillus selenatarsenatis]GAM12393.1 hypothetical protein SAMD00020551_0526 [Mesobacillus selenatarsenatis SF-1]